MSDDIDFEELSSKFEAVKLGMRHSKDGHLLTLAIHPDDTPEDILRDPIGQQYVIVAVRVNQNAEPVPNKNTDEGNRAIALAATLAKNDEFQMWIVGNGHAEEIGEEAATAAIKQHCQIASRKELKTNKAARERLVALRDHFAASYRR